MSTRLPSRAIGVPKAPAGIPSYAASGQRLRNHSREAIERCLGFDPPTVMVTRNKRTGRITAAQFLPRPEPRFT